MFSCCVPSCGGSGSRRPCRERCSRLCRRFTTRARHLWPFSRRSPQSSAQESRPEPTDGVFNSTPLQAAQTPEISSSLKHRRREKKPATLSRKRSGRVPAAAASSRTVGLASTSTVLKILVPQNLFATWEVDCSSPSCVPRWCSLTVTKLVIFQKLAKDLNSVVISVRMRDSKGILRSQEIVLPCSRPVHTNLALTFSLQYNHFLKGEGNKLLILLEQRKCSKNRDVLGYKTLASGAIHMADVMQRNPRCGQMVSLFGSIKESSTAVAEIWISSLCSEPIEHEDSAIQVSPKAKSAGNYEGQDELQASGRGKHRQDLHKDALEKGEPKKQRPSIGGNLKLKVLALFHRSKVSERDLRSDMMGKRRKSDPYLEDDESVLSTPRPKLRPYLDGLSDSSLQTEMWGSHSDRTQTEPLSLPHMPENSWALGGKQPSETDNGFVAHSTPTSKVDNIQISLSMPPINQENSARQASPEAESSDNYSECMCESFFSQREASYHTADQEEGDYDEGTLIFTRSTLTTQQSYQQKVLLWLLTVQGSEEVLDPEEDHGEHVPEVEEDLDLLYDMLPNPSDSGTDTEDDGSVLSTTIPKLQPYFEGLSSGPVMKDNNSVLSSPSPKLRPYMEGLSDSSLQTEMWGSHSDRTQTEPLSLPHMPENSWALGGKQPSETDNGFVAHSTPTSKVDNIQISLSMPPINQENSARQASPEAESSDNYSECMCESFFSQREASYHTADQEEGDYDEGTLIFTRSTLTTQQSYQQKVLLWLLTVQGSEEVLDPEEDHGEHVPEVEEDLDLLYDMLPNPSDSGTDTEDDGSVLSTTIPKLQPYFEGLSSGPVMKDNHSVLSSPSPKLRPYMEGLSDSSLPMEMRGLHSTRIQKEPLSLAHPPENARAPGGKQTSHSDSQLVAYSTPTTKIRMASLSRQPIDQEATAIPASTKAQTSHNHLASTSESCFFEQPASHNAVHRQSQENNLDQGNLIVRRRCMNRQHNYHQEAVASMLRAQVSEKVISSEQALVRHVPKVEKALHRRYDIVLSSSDSSLDTEDDISVPSTPKPKLRRYFDSMSSDSSSDSMAHTIRSPGKQLAQLEDNREAGSSAQHWFTKKLPSIVRFTKSLVLPSSRSKRKQAGHRGCGTALNEWVNRLGNESPYPQSQWQIPRKPIHDQLHNILICQDKMPENIILVNTCAWQGQLLSDILQGHMLPVVCTCSTDDVQEAFSIIVSHMQRYCNCDSQALTPVKMAVAGAQPYFNAVLRVFVRQLSQQPPQWLDYMRFLVIPLGPHPLASYLGSMDCRYNNFFQDLYWRDMFNNLESENTLQDTQDVVSRISEYVAGANCVYLLPIAEAILMSKQQRPNEKSTQLIPFVGAVKVGRVEPSAAMSGGSDDVVTSCSGELLSPTGKNTPNTLSPASMSGSMSSTSQSVHAHMMELQVDYWTAAQPIDTKRITEKKQLPTTKNTLKCFFQSVQVSRLPRSSEGTATPALSMTVVTKERKKKAPKKTTDENVESQSQCIQGIGRLVCRAKHQQSMLPVVIDGVEWNDVAFFQLSAQWSSHVKHFPICIFGHNNPTF